MIAHVASLISVTPLNTSAASTSVSQPIINRDCITNIIASLHLNNLSTLCINITPTKLVLSLWKDTSFMPFSSGCIAIIDECVLDEFWLNWIYTLCFGLYHLDHQDCVWAGQDQWSLLCHHQHQLQSHHQDLQDSSPGHTLYPKLVLNSNVLQFSAVLWSAIFCTL